MDPRTTDTTGIHDGDTMLPIVRYVDLIRGEALKPASIRRAADRPFIASFDPMMKPWHQPDSHSSEDVIFSVTTSTSRGIGLKIRLRIIISWLSALEMFEDTFACVKSMVHRCLFDMARRLWLSVSPCICKSGWVSGKPNSESPYATTVSEFNPGNSSRRSLGLTENKSQHPSDPDFCGKTPATWVISAAAPHHATGNRALLNGFITKHDGLFVHAVDETPLQVVACGTVVTDAVALPDVWLVPALTVNLLSVSQLVRLDYSVEFGRGMCYIRLNDGTIIGKARLRNRQYVLDFLKVPHAM